MADDSDTSDCSDDNITAFEITNLSTVKKRPIIKKDAEKKSQENWVDILLLLFIRNFKKNLINNF